MNLKKEFRKNCEVDVFSKGRQLTRMFRETGPPFSLSFSISSSSSVSPFELQQFQVPAERNRRQRERRGKRSAKGGGGWEGRWERERATLPAIPPAVKGLRGDELLQPADTLLERFFTHKVKV